MGLYDYDKPWMRPMYPPELLDGLRLRAHQTKYPFEPTPPPEPMIPMSSPPQLRVLPGADPMLPWRW